MVPGRSLSGKSTLVLSFVERGADYYSDEYAVFDSEGRVHPYWRLPKLRVASDQRVAISLLGRTLRWRASQTHPLGMGSNQQVRSRQPVAPPAAKLRRYAAGIA